MTTNWKNKKLMEEGKLPKLPEKAPSPAPPPRKDYPVFAHDTTHGFHSAYAIAANRIHVLEEVNKEKDEVIAQKDDWHPYRDCGDAPNVQEYQKETYLCMVQRYAKATGEEVGAVSYQVLLCDDNGMFWGLKSDSLVDYKVIAWKEITGRNYEEAALAYHRQGTVK